MKPLIYSEHLASTRQVGWIRHGREIKYYRNNIRSDSQHPSLVLSECAVIQVCENQRVRLSRSFRVELYEVCSVVLKEI